MLLTGVFAFGPLSASPADPAGGGRRAAPAADAGDRRGGKPGLKRGRHVPGAEADRGVRRAAGDAGGGTGRAEYSAARRAGVLSRTTAPGVPSPCAGCIWTCTRCMRAGAGAPQRAEIRGLPGRSALLCGRGAAPGAGHDGATYLENAGADHILSPDVPVAVATAPGRRPSGMRASPAPTRQWGTVTADCGCGPDPEGDGPHAAWEFVCTCAFAWSPRW